MIANQTSKYRVGIVGISGYGGGEVLRYIAQHPNFELVYAAGESSAGSKLIERFPGLPQHLGQVVIQKWDLAALPQLDVLFASLPTGESKPQLAAIPASTKVIDIGGDHRFQPGWEYGLADIWPERLAGKSRIANPGCYPAASLTALAPLAAAKLIEPAGIIIDAKSGISGAGRGGGSTFGFAEVNEDFSAYGLLKHAHVPEMTSALTELSGTSASITFTPHLLPMTRGILATCYARTTLAVSTEQCFDAARSFYSGRSFVRVSTALPHTKWASGTNLVFVHYAVDTAKNLAIAIATIDNLGKGAAGQAVQNANLALGLPADTGLAAVSLWP